VEEDEDDEDEDICVMFPLKKKKNHFLQWIKRE